MTIVPQVRQFKGNFLQIRDVSGGGDKFRRKVVVQCIDCLNLFSDECRNVNVMSLPSL